MKVEICQESVLHANFHLVSRVEGEIESSGAGLVQLLVVSEISQPNVHFVQVLLFQSNLLNKELLEA